MYNDLISVIVPVYNVEKYLDRCINSIICQTYSNFELILVDDGSPDNCPKMCDKWGKMDERIKVIHQANQGPSAARNVGIKVAKGDYLTFVDSDDWVTDTILYDLLTLIKKYDADISICDFISTDHVVANLAVKDCKETVYSQCEFIKIILRVKSNRCIHYPWGKLYKRSVIDTQEHFPALALGEDVEGMFKAAIASEKIVETNKALYYYFNNMSSITRTKFGENFLLLHQVWRRVSELCKNISPQYQEYVDYNLIRSDFTILTDMILFGDKETDQKYRADRNEVQSRLKSNIKVLMQGPMVMKRKILACIVCYCYAPFRFVYRALRIRRR